MSECSITNADPFRVLKLLNGGQYGSTYLVFHATFGIVANREFRFTPLINDRISAEVRKAAALQRSLLDLNIVTIYDVAYTSTKFWVFVEYMKYGAVDEFLRDYDVSLEWRIQILHEIAAAMTYLHGRQPRILHGDLSCSAILIGDGYHAKLADIGILRILKENSNSSMPEASLKKKVKYIAPEYFTDPRSRNSDKFDVYSFAILSWEILSLKEAYSECADKKEIQEKVGKGERPNIIEIDANVPKWISKIIKKCWNNKEIKRPTFKIIRDSLFAHIIKLQPELRRSYVTMKDQELSKGWSICSQDFERKKIDTELAKEQMRPEFKPAQTKGKLGRSPTMGSTDSDDPYDALDRSTKSCSIGFYSDEELDKGKKHSLNSMELIQNLQYQEIHNSEHARNFSTSKHNTEDLKEEPSDKQLLISHINNHARNLIAPPSDDSRQIKIGYCGGSSRNTKASGCGSLSKCLASHLHDKQLLGEGGFGVVYKAAHRKYGTVAYKILWNVNKDILEEEAKIQMNVDHQNIIKCLAVVEGDFENGLLLEYAANGCIMNYIRKHAPNCQFKLLKIREVCSGMKYLHSLDPLIIHGDLKAQNILLGEKLQAKICDFGFSKLKVYSRSESLNSTQQGTFTHMPPEIWRNPNLRKIESYDVYSFGILMWEIFTGEKPFDRDGNNVSLLSVWVQKNCRPDMGRLPSEIKNEFRDLIQKCWHGIASNRPTFELIEKALENFSLQEITQVQN